MTMLLVIAGAIISAAGVLPYVSAVMRGTVRPRLVSWGIWAVLSGVMTVSSFMEGQAVSTVMAFEAFVSCSVIVMLGWRHRSLGIGRIDVICLIGALAGLASLIVFRNPLVALTTAIAVDAVAFVPTLLHGWERPAEESLACFVLATIGAVLASLAALQQNISFAGLAYPLYSLIANGLMAALLMAGRMGTEFAYSYEGEES